MSTISLYDILKLKPSCNRSDIKKAYRELVKIAHPDKGGNPELFELITHAYNTLSNSKLKTEYDNETKLLELETDHFKMKKDMEDYFTLQESNITFESKETAKDIFKKEKKDIDDKMKLTNNNLPIPEKEIKTKLKDLEVTREQEDIENIHDQIFENGKFDLNKFNTAFDIKHGSSTELIIHEGNPNAWDSYSANPVSFCNIDNYDAIFNENTDVNSACFAPIDQLFIPNNTSININKDNIEDAPYTQSHNNTDEQYNKTLEQKLKEREFETSQLKSLSINEFKTTDDTMGGYGIFHSLGPVNGWDDLDVKKKYNEMLSIRNKKIE
jgi:hypothetical protein